MVGKIVNFVLFQITWLASVVGAARGLPWLGPLCLLWFMAWQLAAVDRSLRELLLVLTVAIGGMLVDSGYVASGILTYASPEPSALVAPVWIVGMWANFALTLNHSMSWLHNRYVAAAVLGGIGGPLAYWGGERLGAMEFTSSMPAVLGVISIVWALATPAMVRLAEYFDRWEPAPLAGAVERE